MLHIVYANPEKSNLLLECLDKMKEDDALLLMGEAVLAMQSETLMEKLEKINKLYVSEVALNEFGINVWIGSEVTAEDIVKIIVAEKGSPLTWK